VRSIGFWQETDEDSFMYGSVPSLIATRFSLRCVLALGLALIAAVASMADTSGMLRRAAPAGCQCDCSQSHAHAGCTKMCRPRRRASRWAAVTCVKPRIKIPAETPGAGPRFPRSDRAERASR